MTSVWILRRAVAWPGTQTSRLPLAQLSRSVIPNEIFGSDRVLRPDSGGLNAQVVVTSNIAASRPRPAPFTTISGGFSCVVPQNLIRADGNAGELPGRANAVDFESGKRCRHGYTALFLSRSTRRQRDASLRERTQRTADEFFDCLG